MTGLPNIILPSDLVGQPRSHNAPPSRSPNSSFNSQRADPCTESSSSLATTSSFPYSNTFDMRHGYSPYLVPRRANSSIGQSSSRDPFSYEDSTPFFSHSERPAFYHPSTSSSPLLHDSETLVDDPSSRLPSFEYGSPMDFNSPGLHPPTPSLTPRDYPPLSTLLSGSELGDPHRHHYHHHHHVPHNLPAQFSNSHNVFNARGSEDPTEAELKTLQRKVRELEAELEGTKSHRILGVTPPDFEARLKYRERKFCSLNRAGNALCAWHDSRRERRLYPPRMAPHRTLNCGCTYDEALFEESLARNGVGSFWPGESVRMDPVLRNSLLSLIRRVYGYNDGDFERNPDGTWKEGQDAVAWEERARRPARRERS